jgi:carboxymethylenebutenolidase
MPRNPLGALFAFACFVLEALSRRVAGRIAAAPRRGPVLGSFLSGGKRITVERFEPARPGKYPALVLLHGLDGLEGPSAATYRSIAGRMAAKGHVVLLVHYFDRTDTKKEDLPALLKEFRAYLANPEAGGTRWQALRATFDAWRSTVGDAVAHARRHPPVGPAGRVGVVGVSMGGFLATSVAAEVGLRIACVAELFGGMPREIGASLRQMPPTLIIHGDEDRIVPVGEAHALRDLLAARQLPFEALVYKSIGHVFATAGGGTSWQTAWDTERRTTSFLARHLRTTAPAAKAGIVQALPTLSGIAKPVRR